MGSASNTAVGWPQERLAKKRPSGCGRLSDARSKAHRTSFRQGTLHARPGQKKIGHGRTWIQEAVGSFRRFLMPPEDRRCVELGAAPADDELRRTESQVGPARRRGASELEGHVQRRRPGQIREARSRPPGTRPLPGRRLRTRRPPGAEGRGCVMSGRRDWSTARRRSDRLASPQPSSPKPGRTVRSARAETADGTDACLGSTEAHGVETR